MPRRRPEHLRAALSRVLASPLPEGAPPGPPPPAPPVLPRRLLRVTDLPAAAEQLRPLERIRGRR